MTRLRLLVVCLALGCLVGAVAATASDPRIDALITIQRKADVAERRAALVASTWGTTRLPRRLPEVTRGIVDARYAGLANLRAINRLTVRMPYDVHSVVYEFKPRKSNRRLVVWLSGHHQDFFYGRSLIEFFLAKGYTVAGIAMPLYGMNPRPIVEINGTWQIVRYHAQLECFPRPLQFFVTPLAVVLNYFQRTLKPISIATVGFSGGGYTAAAYAALDPRVQLTYAISGTTASPFVRQALGQGRPPDPNPDPPPAGLGCGLAHFDGARQLREVANPLDQYVLGAYGPQRRLVLVFNDRDSIRNAYTASLQERLWMLRSGSFDVVVDLSFRGHAYSQTQVSAIHADMLRYQKKVRRRGRR